MKKVEPAKIVIDADIKQNCRQIRNDNILSQNFLCNNVKAFNLKRIHERFPRYSSI